MSETEATRFINDMQNDSEFAAEMHKLRNNPTAAYQMVKDKGYNATTEEISAAFLEFSATCMSEENLEAIAAGLSKFDKGLIAGSVVGGAAAVVCVAGAAAAAL